MRLEKISPGKREESRDSFQYPLGVYRLPEGCFFQCSLVGYKCLGGHFKFLPSFKILSRFLVFCDGLS